MVSKNPNPPEGLYLDPNDNGMPLPGLGPFASVTATTSTTSSSAEDLSKKIRKPYTITKSRESWSEPEHDKFLEALQLFDRDWKKIEAFIGSKTVIQIRSHAQKYFLKVQKNGTSEHLPPPRPKRKAAHPYPQKASKNALALPPVSWSCQSSSALLESGFNQRPDSSSMLMSPIPGPVAPSWPNGSVQTANPSHESKVVSGPTVPNNSCSTTESTPKAQPVGGTTDQVNHSHALRVLPDFTQVYGFIGSVFDPNVTGHLQNLKKMDPIDVETVLLLMRNLSMNLTNPEFEDHRQLLSSYKMDADTGNLSDATKTLCDDQHEKVA
ncbi:protein REVEILLE 6-like isoform X1 [Pyrus communis]|uniref:protein REVEILLE 6-like isoform X1 n=1 Tax=Pyrus communis TaxID=23211 RepID=UPI0035BEEF1B